MKIKLLLFLLLSQVLFAEFNSNISTIDSNIKARMLKGNSWKRGCPVSLSNLRYIQMTYLDFNGQTSVGEMIVHKDVAQEVVYIFEDLYHMNYAIHKMQLISDYNGNDWESIEADNTSAFNCRRTTGKKTWSRHSYGQAIDINPIENPYISKSGHISHKASEKYRKRVHYNLNNLADRAMLHKNDPSTKKFKEFGWTWGGDWYTTKDYQHFVKK